MAVQIKKLERSKTEQEDFAVNILGDRFTVNVVYASSDSDVKRWARRMMKNHRQKLQRRKLVVALNFERSFNYAHGKYYWTKLGKSLKDRPYELAAICVENDVLLCHLDDNYGYLKKWFPNALKDLLNDNGVTVVGVGIEKFVRKMERDFEWIVTNKVVDLRDLASAAIDPKERNMERFGVAKLARAILGEEMELVKPVKITWWDQQYRYDDILTEDMIKFATVEVFLARLIGTSLLNKLGVFF